MVLTGCLRNVEEAYKTINWDSIGQRTASALERGLKDVVAVLARELNEAQSLCDGSKQIGELIIAVYIGRILLHWKWCCTCCRRF